MTSELLDVQNVSRRGAGRNAQVEARQALFLLLAVACLSPWLSPAIALAIGTLLGLLKANPNARFTHRASKYLLQACVVLLGFSMNLPVILHAGIRGAGLAAATIAATVVLGYPLGRWLGINRQTRTLISAGTAICGGSAIAAVGSVIEAGEGDMTVAMGVIFLLNGLALYLFPAIGHALHLSPEQFGTWAGVAIHDVSSVVGAADRYGLGALQTATAVKLSRALWIIPLTFGILWSSRRTARLANAEFGFDPKIQNTPGKIQIPWFIGLFLLASLLRSIFPHLFVPLTMAISLVASRGLALTLFLVGTGISLEVLRAVGWKALALGVTLWAFVSVASLLFVKAFA